LTGERYEDLTGDSADAEVGQVLGMSVREDIVHKLAVVRIADRVAAGHMEVARWRMAAEGKARHQPQARSTTLSLGSSLGKGVKKEDEFES
jgi:hypothetical protein